MEQAPVRYYEAAEPPVRAAVGGSDFLRAVSNIDLMDALKEARPDAYNDLILTKKIGKCVLAKEKAVDSNESTAFILVEVTGLEPAASWSQTTRATNCATPRSYSLPIIIHEGCRRQAPTAVDCGAYGKYHARRRRSPRINRWVG